MKYLIKNNQIVISGIVSNFTRSNGQVFVGGYENMTEFHYEDGWRDDLVPEIDNSLQCIDWTSAYYDPTLDKVTYKVIDLYPGMTLETAKVNKIKEIKQKSNELLAKTDWYIIRKSEKSKSIPAEVTSERDSIRLKSDKMEQLVNSKSTIKEVITFEIIF